MYFSFVVLFLSLGVADSETTGIDWCYTGCHNTPNKWGNLTSAFCGGKKQSPINIVTSHVKTDENLGNFTFVNFSSRDAFHRILNTGHTINVNLRENVVELSGGGLNGIYSVIQFHFHWGDTEHHPGSEHLIDDHRFPMEMHIVSLKKGFTVEEAVADPEGMAVLGFLINATDTINMTDPWTKLTSHLKYKTEPAVNVTDAISISDLLGNVDLTKFYRYKGSLTTPFCNEAVVWTVFEEPIQVHKVLIQRFPTMSGLTNVYRPSQSLNGRQVFASPAVQLPSSHGWCYDDHHCAFNPSHWQFLPGSYCGGDKQSPVDINTKHTVVDKHLQNFIFTNYDDKHAIKYITNTGHTVKCVLKEDTVEMSGGGLGHVYSTREFHFHWASPASDSVGSEHLVDSKRYPMEMHIVNKRKDLTLDEAVKTDNGLAVLGFFIEATDSTKSSGRPDAQTEEPTPRSKTDPWKQLTSYFSHVQNISSMVEFTAGISIDDLLGDVDRTLYYRYNGSLTTPSCNEAVVWTVFKESVKVDRSLMVRFPAEMGYHDVYRPVQSLHGRTIYTTSVTAAPGPALLVLLLTLSCGFL